MSLRTALIVTAALLLGPGPASAAAEPSLAAQGLDALREAIVAAGVSDAARADALEATLRGEVQEIVGRIGPGLPTYHRAARLHRLLHRKYLLHYRDDADGLHQLAERGEFNCLSATLFYGLVARELGYGVRVLESPGHLLLELDAAGRRIRIETTSVRGFDREDDVPSVAPAEPAGVTYLLPPGRDRAQGGDGYRRVSLEEAVGFVWLNAAWRALDAGATVRAAHWAAEARRFLAGEPLDGDAQRLFSRAFRAEYEAGSFDDAYRIATIEVLQFPGMTTSHDRLFAAAVKRVEDACDDDDPTLAAAIAEEVSGLSGASREAGRFERRAWPVVAAAAVRLADWELAQGAAERYARVEPDPVEAERVLEWVDARMARDLAGAGPQACAELYDADEPRPLAP